MNSARMRWAAALTTAALRSAGWALSKKLGLDSSEARLNAHVARLLGGRGDYPTPPAPPLNDADAVAFLQPSDGIEPKRAEERRGG